MMSHCLVGSGNSEPTITQNQLDSCVVGVTGTNYSNKYDYVNDGSNTYKCNVTKKYVFTTLAGQNISEVGLASRYAGPASNYLCTRALIKDTNGSPTVLSLITGDTLTIYYRLWVVHSVLDVNQIINMSDGFGGIEPYNVKIRPLQVGLRAEWATYLNTMLSPIYKTDFKGYSGDIVDISNPNISGVLGASSGLVESAYNNDYTKKVDITFNTSSANGNIRTLTLLQTEGNIFGSHQIRFGRVSDDAPIAKDNTKELTIPIKFTWGRYEGVL